METDTRAAHAPTPFTASNLLAVDINGQVIEGTGEVEATAYYIHARLHLAHPRARWILHTHMPYATALCSIRDGTLDPVTINSLRFNDDVGYDRSYNGEARPTAEGDRIAALLGSKRILFLANHGVIVVGDTVAQAFDDLYFLERACMVQVLAMSTGRPLSPVTSIFRGRLWRQSRVKALCRLALRGIETAAR